MRAVNPPCPQRPVAESLERKLLYSADLAPLALDAASVNLVDSPVQVLTQATATATTSTAGVELVFIDGNVDNADALAQDLADQAAQGRALHVVRIQGDEDGIERISQTLAAWRDVTAVHLVAHGQDGALTLGSSVLDAGALLQRATEVAGWGLALQPEGDFLLYGCDVAASSDGQAFVADLALLTGADVAASTDLTGHRALGGDWQLEAQVGAIDAQALTSAAFQSDWAGTLAMAATPSSPGVAVWAEAGFTAPQQSRWDGFTLGPQGTTALNTQWTVVSSAQSPKTQQAIVVGADSNGTLRAQQWNGSSWSAVPLNPLGTGTASNRQGAAVAYEQNSGDAVMVWNDGTTLRYSIFNGSNWSSARTVSGYTGAAPEQIRMVSRPGGDELAIVVSDANADDHALIWNGNSWGHAVSLDTSGTSSNDQVASAIAFESLSGRAVVAYGKSNNSEIYYRVFNGSGWSNEKAVEGYEGPATPRWITLASDPSSNRVAMGINSVDSDFTNYASFTVWSGSSWGQRAFSSGHFNIVPGSTVAVGFESVGGDLLAVYGTTSSNLRFATWNSSTGWSSAQTGPALGGTPGAVRLYSDPATQQIMLGAQTLDGRLSYTAWTGSGWATTTTVATDTGSTVAPAFTWLWSTDVSGNKTHTLWLGPDQTTTGWNGVNQVTGTGLVEFGDPGLSYGAGTSGTFSHVVDLAAFGAMSVDDIVWVSQTVPLATGLEVRRGDLIFTVGTASTLTSGNSLTVDNNDVVMFRPTTAGDYSHGTFTLLIDALGSSLLGLGTAPDVKGLALVEQTTQLGDVTLNAGEILFTVATGGSSNDIMRFSPQSYGLLGNVLTGSVSTLIRGGDVGINKVMGGLELVSSDTVLKNVTVPAGSLLLSLNQGGLAGDNALSVTPSDVFVLTPSTTSVNTTAQADATLLFQGASVGLGGRAIDSLALSLDAAPVITSQAGAASAVVVVNENSTAVTTVSGQDADPGTRLVYSISGGSDAGRFEIDATTGVLRFKTAPNFEAPTDNAGDNVYEVTVTASDGTLTDSQSLQVSVTNVNEAPSITSNGGGPYAVVNVAGGTTAITQVAATDPDAGAVLTYSLGSLADEAVMVINPSTGELSFRAPVAFDAANPGNNTYQAYVFVRDQGGISDGQWVIIQVTQPAPTNQAPVITSEGGLDSASLIVTEGELAVTTVQATDTDSPHLTYSIIGGADRDLFVIDASTGQLSFKMPTDVTAPADADGNNIYDVVVHVTDGQDSDSQALAIALNAYNRPPVNTLPGAFSAAEDRALEIVGLQVSDRDAGSNDLTVTLSTSHGRLVIRDDVPQGLGSTQIVYSDDGLLVTLRGSQDALNATFAAEGGVVYVPQAEFNGSDTLTMTSDDGGASGLPRTPAQINDEDSATITVTPVNDAPVIAENTLLIVQGGQAVPTVALSDIDQMDQDALQLEVDDVQGGRFIRTDTGEDVTEFTLAQLKAGLIVFEHDGTTTPPSYTLVASDGQSESTTSEALVTLNLTPVITSWDGAGTAAVDALEGSAMVGQVTATDAEGSPITYSLAGADSALFALDAATGELRFITPPDITLPAYADHARDYVVVVRASDGGSWDEQTVTIHLKTINRAPVNTLPATFTTDEDQPLTLTGIRVDDRDAGNAEITVTLTVAHGTLNLRADVDGGLNASQILRTADGRQLTLTGTTSAINASLGAQALAYTPDGNYHGNDTLVMLSNDQGATGVAPDGSSPGPTLTATRQSAVAVTPVNDAPSASGNALTISQGGTAVPEINVSDVDSPANQILVTPIDLAGGQFVRTGDLAPLAQFTLAQLQAGEIRFQHDGTSSAPSYRLEITDGETMTLSAPAQVSFTPAPVPEPPPPPPPPPGPAIIPPPPADAVPEAPAEEPPSEETPDVPTAPPPAGSPASGGAALAPAPLPAQLASLPPTAAGLSPPAVGIDAPTVQISTESASRTAPLTEAAAMAVDGFQYRWTGSLPTGTAADELRRNLDALRDQLQDHGIARRYAVASSIALSTGLSVGYVIWLVRGGALLGSMLSAMPAWQMIDPLPVLHRGRHRTGVDGEGDQDSPLENLFDDAPAPQAAPAPAVPPAVPPDDPPESRP